MHRPKKTRTYPNVLIKKAKKFMGEQGYFLLLYDVIGSQEFLKDCSDPQGEYTEPLWRFQKEVNSRFKDSIVIRFVGSGRKLERFRTIIGDGGGAYFSDPEVIVPLIELAKEMLPFALRWGVAKDGWDKKGTEIVR